MQPGRRGEQHQDAKGKESEGGWGGWGAHDTKGGEILLSHVNIAVASGKSQVSVPPFVPFLVLRIFTPL
jgi:hypothetical protein